MVRGLCIIIIGGTIFTVIRLQIIVHWDSIINEIHDMAIAMSSSRADPVVG